MAFHLETGYLKIILGSMFSGKTTELIREYKRFTSCGYECLFINHELDKRYNSNDKQTATHDGNYINSLNIGSKLFDFFTKESFLSRYDVIFINEGQFFDDLYEFVDYAVNEKKKRVYVCGLDGDFKRKKFGALLDIIPLCDDLVKLKAICKGCTFKEGIFTFRLSNEKEQTVIGADNYVPLCRKCYNNRYFNKKI
mgnify:FL=1|tara:strand:- start:6151 stop:6738 length:588 start_codon:yes stop_codon:yes gene_type:complete